MRVGLYALLIWHMRQSIGLCFWRVSSNHHAMFFSEPGDTFMDASVLSLQPLVCLSKAHDITNRKLPKISNMPVQVRPIYSKMAPIGYGLGVGRLKKLFLQRIQNRTNLELACNKLAMSWSFKKYTEISLFGPACTEPIGHHEGEHWCKWI